MHSTTVLLISRRPMMPQPDAHDLIRAVRTFLDIEDRGATAGEVTQWIDDWEAALRTVRALVSTWPK